MASCDTPSGKSRMLLHVIEVGCQMPMDSSQIPPLNDPRVGVDVTAELTAPPPDPAWQPAPAAQSASVPSAKSFELIDQLDALARDFAISKRGSSNQCIETSEEVSSISAGLQPE